MEWNTVVFAVVAILIGGGLGAAVPWLAGIRQRWAILGFVIAATIVVLNLEMRMFGDNATAEAEAADVTTTGDEAN